MACVALVGCVSDDPLEQSNSWANVRFDGHVVGRWPDDVSGQAIACERAVEGGPVARIVDDERWPEDPTEWLVLGDDPSGERWVWLPTEEELEAGVETHLELRLPTDDQEVSVELVVGDAVYRSDDATDVTVVGRPGDAGTYRDDLGARVTIEGLVGGRAVFRGLPLHHGRPFLDKQRLGRLVIEWDCLGRPDRWTRLRRASSA